MATAEELLARLANPTTEPHIVIDAERFITVPDELKRIAVQFDHDIETVTFDCPRYWDGNDMSQMKIYINYMTPDNRVGSYHSQLVTVDPSDTNIMHFTWTISNNVTRAKGSLSFLVCIKKVNSEGNEVNHWNSELNRQMTISEGLECEETILEENPDVLTFILTRLDTLEALNGIGSDTVILELDTTLKIPGRAADAAVVGTKITNLETALETLQAEPDYYELDLTTSVTVDSTTTATQQVFDITNLVDGEAIMNAVNAGKSVRLIYTDPNNLLGVDCTTSVVLSNVNILYIEGAGYVAYIRGFLHNVYNGRHDEIYLCIDEADNWSTKVFYVSDPSGSSSNNGESTCTCPTIHVVSATTTSGEIADIDFSKYSEGDIILITGLQS